MAVYGYIFCPVSRDEEPAPGRQEQLLSEYCTALGLSCDSWVVEKTVSLKKPLGERPEGAKLMAGLQAGDAIVVLKAAWVLASASEGEQLLRTLGKRAVSLHCVDLGENISLPGERKLVVSEGNSVLVRKVLAALAVCERTGHGEAIRAVKKSRRLQGKYLGGPVPFGWLVNDAGVLEEDPQQQEVIERIRSMREDRRSYREIAATLHDSIGLSLSHEGIRRILANDTRRKEERRT